MNRDKLSEILNRAAQGQSFTNRQEVNPNTMDIESDVCGPCIEKLRGLGYTESDWCEAYDRFKSEYELMKDTCEPNRRGNRPSGEEAERCARARNRALEIIYIMCEQGEFDKNSRCCQIFGNAPYSDPTDPDNAFPLPWNNLCGGGYSGDSQCLDIIKRVYKSYNCNSCNVDFYCRLENFSDECRGVLESAACRSICPKKEDRIVNR